MTGRDSNGPADGSGAVPPLFDPPRRESAGSRAPAHGGAKRGKAPVEDPLPPPPPLDEPPIQPPGREPSIPETLPAEPMRPSEWFTVPLEEAGPDWWRAVLRWGRFSCSPSSRSC